MSTDTGPPATVGGRYTVGDLIGRGGAADVFRARDELLGRDVAIKMFNAAGSVVADERVPGRSRRPRGEDRRHRGGPGGPPPARGPHPRRALAPRARHGLRRRRRGRPRVLRHAAHRGRHARAARSRSGPLPVVDVVALGAALADALAYVHRRGVVHRDVKPGNVLLDAEGRAHLSDFGIAAVHDAAPVTAAGMVIGTASYLSPEQVRGEPIDGAVDIYALGLVLIECLTGRREYPGNALEAAVARLHRRPVVPPGLPPGLEVAADGDDRRRARRPADRRGGRRRPARRVPRGRHGGRDGPVARCS